MLERDLDTVLDADAFDVVVVSTEDDEIAAIAERRGVLVHERPADLREDTTGAAEITLSACDHVERTQGARIGVAACLAPVYPLLRPESVARAVAEFAAAPDANFLMSVHQTDPHDFHWALRDTGDGYAELWFGKEFLKDRAFLPPAYSATGAIKLARPAALR